MPERARQTRRPLATICQTSASLHSCDPTVKAATTRHRTARAATRAVSCLDLVCRCWQHPAIPARPVRFRLAVTTPSPRERTCAHRPRRSSTHTSSLALSERSSSPRASWQRCRKRLRARSSALIQSCSTQQRTTSSRPWSATHTPASCRTRVWVTSFRRA